jgi:Uma2 family endonuclease
MIEPTPAGPLTYEEFRAYIADKEGRFEFVGGRVVAMGNPSDVHQAIVARLVIWLDAYLSGTPWVVLPSIAIKTQSQQNEARERVPDVVVKCAGAPKVVIEVLSPNRGDDLESKAVEYAGVASIAEYVLIDSTKRWALQYRRNAQGRFELAADYIGGVMKLESIGYELDLGALYTFVGVWQM